MLWSQMTGMQLGWCKEFGFCMVFSATNSFLEFYTVWHEFCRQQQWRAQYSSFLKGTIWTTSNASMLTINQPGKNPSMVIAYIITSHKFCIFDSGFLHNWERACCLDSVYVLFNCVACFCLQTCSWMWRAAKMFMSLLTSMLKLRGLRVKTSTRLNSLVCRLGLLWKYFSSQFSQVVPVYE